MATKQKKRKQRPNRIVDKLIVTYTRRARHDIAQWQAALALAENPERPRRWMLYNIYRDILLDPHLTAEIQKRTLAVTGASYRLIDKNGKDSDRTELLQREWFDKLLQWILEARFWGHSLIQIDTLHAGEIDRLELVDRRHVVPEQGLFLPNMFDDKAIQYRDPKYYRWLIEVGEYRDLGLLNKAVPHVLFKRFAQSAWSEFTEIFGMPIRIAKTNTKDKEALNRMEQMMVDMSTAFYAIIDHDEVIEFIETAKTDGAVYDKLIDRSNSEISKLISGAVLGERSPGGSRAKEQVGKDISDQITAADRRWIGRVMNHYVLPKLISLGYPFQGLRFVFDVEPDINQLWEITSGVLNHYDVDPEFIRTTFGIPVTGKKEQQLGIPDDFFD